MSTQKPSKNYPKRGEIWATDLRPGAGWEIAKIRPALVISSNAINQISPMVIVIPISSQIPSVLGPERILVLGKKANLKKESVILTTQIRSADKSRLKKKDWKAFSGKTNGSGRITQACLGNDRFRLNWRNIVSTSLM